MLRNRQRDHRQSPKLQSDTGSHRIHENGAHPWLTASNEALRRCRQAPKIGAIQLLIIIILVFPEGHRVGGKQP